MMHIFRNYRTEQELSKDGGGGNSLEKFLLSNLPLNSFLVLVDSGIFGIKLNPTDSS